MKVHVEVFFVNIIIADKKLYACKTAIDDFKTILDTVGGPQEHIRANELLQEIIIVEDQPSSRALALQSSAKIKDRGKVWHFFMRKDNS